MLIDEVFLVYAYTAPLSIQCRLLNEKPYEAQGWPYFKHAEHGNLFKEALQLFLEEISLRRDSPIDLDELLSLRGYLEITKTSSMEDFLIQCLELGQFKEPLSMETLLKNHGLPSKIPAIKGVFRASETILSAIKSSFGGDNLSVDLDGLNPIWTRIVLPALNVKGAGLDADLPECVLQQAQLYLATSKPFLLFKFDPSLYTNTNVVIRIYLIESVLIRITHSGTLVTYKSGQRNWPLDWLLRQCSLRVNQRTYLRSQNWL